jgi:hypothetical protein
MADFVRNATQRGENGAPDPARPRHPDRLDDHGRSVAADVAHHRCGVAAGHEGDVERSLRESVPLFAAPQVTAPAAAVRP